ncbi:MAG: hypothetical protein JWP44_4394 [Mucilaginibacter sp.]|nr:hypothetical protein [Mucilaginibacter sp.]
MKKIDFVLIPSLTALLLVLNGCAENDDKPAQVCIDPVTNIRVDDAKCTKVAGTPTAKMGGTTIIQPSPFPYYYWFYIHNGSYVRSVGQTIDMTAGSARPMSGINYSHASPTVSRGGFGSSGESFGGHSGSFGG